MVSSQSNREGRASPSSRETVARAITRSTLRNFFERFLIFATMAAQERAKTKGTIRGTDLAYRPVCTFLTSYVARKGYRDGMSGLLVSGLAPMYPFVKYAKLFEKTLLSGKHKDAPCR